MGLTRIAVAFAGRGQPNAGLVGLSGFAGLLIGILVLAKFPSSADWAIGLLVGIDLIFAGWTLTSVAWSAKTSALKRRRLTSLREPQGSRSGGAPQRAASSTLARPLCRQPSAWPALCIHTIPW